MNFAVLTRWLRFEAHAVRRIIRIMADRSDERRWSRDVRRTHTDDDIPFPWPTHFPKPVGPWPFVRTTPPDPHPLSKVLRALEAAKPSNVIRMKGVA